MFALQKKKGQECGRRSLQKLPQGKRAHRYSQGLKEGGALHKDGQAGKGEGKGGDRTSDLGRKGRGKPGAVAHLKEGGDGGRPRRGKQSSGEGG